MRSIKLVMVIIVFWVFTLSSSAQAKEFDRNALSLLTDVFTYCPIQFIQAMKGATSVGRATYTYDDAIHYSITTVNITPLPDNVARDVATLNIYRVPVKSDSDEEDRDTSDGPPPEWTTACELVTH